MTPTVRRYVTGILLALLTMVVVVTIPNGSGPPTTITVRLGAPSIERADLPDTLTVDRSTLAAVTASTADHADSRSEAPDGVPAAELRAGQRQQDDLAQRDDLPVVTPAAAPEQAGCRSRFVRNYSSRRGVRPRLFVVHFTVSSNRAGWGDVDAITGLFNTPSFAASSNYVVDDEAHCNYIVRESDKAWTQATFNPVSISVEIIATGSEGRLTSAGGYKLLGRIISDATRRWDIPLQTGKTSGCTVVRSGVVDHRSLGACGGNHGDISPYALAPVLAAAKAARAGGSSSPSGYRALTAGERAHVDILLAERRSKYRHGGKWSSIAKSHHARANRAATWIKARLKTIASGAQAQRPARRVYLRRVVADGAMPRH